MNATKRYVLLADGCNLLQPFDNTLYLRLDNGF